VILSGSRWPTRLTRSGAIAASSSTAASKFGNFWRKKWNREHEYRLVKELWAFTERRIAVRFQKARYRILLDADFDRKMKDESEFFFHPSSFERSKQP
jgi:nuclear transport factor 2 (NTF2) superfamily protein